MTKATKKTTSNPSLIANAYNTINNVFIMAHTLSEAGVIGATAVKESTVYADKSVKLAVSKIEKIDLKDII